ncbi:hypothetical protein HYZ98_03180 [Candidatus Peregrinibacteria bacterium]|nr:hypothetical protein [Candidatus Peregrinibacteria bacterium]
MRLVSVLSHHRILGSAAILGITQLGASIAGLLRDRLLAQTFPDLAVVDAYIAAFRPSDLIFQVLVMSAIGMILVPLLAREEHRRGREGVANLLGASMGLGCLIFGLVALLLTLVLPMLVPWLVNFQGEQLAWYINFARIVLISNLLMVIGNTIGQELIHIERYWVYGLTPIVYSLGTIGGTLFLTPVIGPYGPIAGTVAGSLIYALWRLLAVRWAGIPLRVRLWHPAIADMGWMAIPRMIALGTLHIRLLVLDTLASSLPTGAITINAYARNVQSVIVGAIGIALAQAIFSPMCRAAAEGNERKFQNFIRRGSFFMLLLTIPSALILFLIPDLVAWIVNLQHKAPLFSVVLMLYAFSIPIESLSYLFIRAFFALHNTRLPAIAHSANAIVAIALSWSLLGVYGLPAIPIGFIAGHVVQLVILWWNVPRRIS